jgi:hypothetical protein
MYNSKLFHLQLNYYKNEEKCIKSTKLFKYKKNNLKSTYIYYNLGNNKHSNQFNKILEKEIYKYKYI